VTKQELMFDNQTENPEFSNFYGENEKEIICLGGARLDIAQLNTSHSQHLNNEKPRDFPLFKYRSL